jgi:hypothetical protein
VVIISLTPHNAICSSGAAPQGDGAPGETQPEVTPEMIEAGITAYYSRRRFPADDTFDEAAAVRVYVAMWESGRSVR